MPRARLWIILALLAAGAGVFIAGAFAGRWASETDFVYRARQTLEAWRSGERASDAGAWRPKETQLARLEYREIELPNADGRGGGLGELSDGRLLYAVGHGGFGVIDATGTARALDFSIDMNLAALQQHPVFKAHNFSYFWVRVTDISLTPLGSGRYELLVGHHRFDAENQCMELWLSRGVIDASRPGITLERPFERVMKAKPCITFYGPDYQHAFEGHFSGGRIVPLNARQVLFSTGDHGWIGLRGYPALSADPSVTLGKILKVDVATGATRPYAIGIRNPQGLLRDREGRIWETEHGPRGGDELNQIVEGGDFGWPDNTYGTDYGPLPWTRNPVQGRHTGGVAPTFAWNPSIGVSNLVQAGERQFPLWAGDLLVTSLYGESIHRLRLEGSRVVYDEPIRFEGYRLRDIIELTDGRLATMTDEGKVILVRNGDRDGAPPFLDPRRQQTRSEDMTPDERARAVAGFYAGAPPSAQPAPAALSPAAMRGLAVFQEKCASCHTLTDAAGAGPSLKGVVGRTVGATAFAYSDALAGRRERWTARRITAFAANPGGLYPGSVMPAAQLTSGERRNLEQFLITAR